MFSDKVSLDEKRKIAEAMSQAGDDWRHRVIRLPDSADLETKELYQLIDASSASALHSIGGNPVLQYSVYSVYPFLGTGYFYFYFTQFQTFLPSFTAYPVVQVKTGYLLSKTR